MIGVAGGKHIHRVQLQKRVESSRDADGGINESWTTVETFWASVTPVSGRERLVAEGVSSEVTHLVRLRYKAGITAKNRLLHNVRSSLATYASAGTPWKTATSPTDAFTDDMVGQYFTVTAGTNWIAGDYEITAVVDSKTITVDAPVAAEDVTSGTGFVNRQLAIVDAVDLEEDRVTTEIRCVEKVT